MIDPTKGDSMTLSRRRFLGRAAAVTAGFGGLQALGPFLDRGLLYAAESGDRGYGPLVADPASVLDLPRGFSYRVFSRLGETMDDGLLVPGLHDGMAAFPGPDGLITLVRNHELRETDDAVNAFGENNELLGRIDVDRVFDARTSGIPTGGGTVTLLYDPVEGKLVHHGLSLAGTLRNCAGGSMPWNSWITCEETMSGAGNGGLLQDHGYNFEVPADASVGLVRAEPLRAMGRFRHEAVALDPRTGIVYQTEDRSESLFYRFLPAEAGRLGAGGVLQALVVRGQPQCVTNNWDTENVIVPGTTLEVEWIDMEDVANPDDLLRFQGHERGAARFTRGEGMWTGEDGIYFTCTDGGHAHKGQVWRYRPSAREGTGGERDAPGRLELFLEPNDGKVIENCDNVTTTPWGDLILCEDGPGEQFLVGVTPEGKTYSFARNAQDGSEFAGACFSPDGSTLFVNLFSGSTVAITGPWMRREG